MSAQHVDTEALRRRVDIVAEIERTVHLKKAGSNYAGLCPFHDNHRTPALAVFPNTQTWRCFGACDIGGDVIAWVMKRDNCDFMTACRTLDGGPMVLPPRPAMPAPPPAPVDPPGPRWQMQAQAFIAECTDVLWSDQGAKARAWLHARGLDEFSLRARMIGFNPEHRFAPLADWGIESDDPSQQALRLHRGIVIPCLAESRFWYIKVRQASGEPKYLHIRRDHQANALYMADHVNYRRVVVFVEGEFDAALLYQSAGDLAGVTTLGAQGNELPVGKWGPYLLDAELILAAYDQDGKSDKGLRKLLGASARIQPIAIPALRPGDKDITDYWKSGGDLCAWLHAERERALSQIFPDAESQIAHVERRLAAGLPPLLAADYKADLAELRSASSAQAVPPTASPDKDQSRA